MTINHTAEPGEIRFLKKFSFTLRKKHFLPYSIYDIFRTYQIRHAFLLVQSRSKGEIPGRARGKERLSRSKLKKAFLTDSDAKLFMYFIQCIRFGS